MIRFCVGYGKNLLVFDSENGKVKTVTPHRNEIKSVFVDSSKNIYSGSADRKIVKTDSSNFKQIMMYRGHFAAVGCIDLFENETRMVSGSNDKKLRIWNVENGKTLMQLKSHGDWVSDVKYLPGIKRILSSSHDKYCKLWDIGKGVEIKKILLGSDKRPDDRCDGFGDFDPDEYGKSYVVHSFDFDPDLGILVVGGGGGNLRTYSMKDEEFNNLTVTNHKNDVHSVLCLPGRREVLCESKGVMFQYDLRVALEHGREIRSWKAHEKDITSMDKLDQVGFVTVSRDKGISIWNFEGNNIKRFQEEEYYWFPCVAVM